MASLVNSSLTVSQTKDIIQSIISVNVLLIWSGLQVKINVEILHALKAKDGTDMDVLI